MNTYYLKYQKYKSKYINLKYLQQGGAEQNLVYNHESQLIENNDLAIGNPKEISNKKNILSMVDKSDALKFSYDTLTKNFKVETPGEYKGTILTMDDLTMDDRGSEVRFCQLWESISGLNRQQFEFDENAIYAIDTNMFILKVFGDDLLFKQIETNAKILLNFVSFQGNYLAVKKIIESDIDTYTDKNWTQILHNAIMSKNRDIVSFLLTKAIAINLNDLYIFTEHLLDKSSSTNDKEDISNILIIIIKSMIQQYLTFDLDYNFDKIIDIDKDILNQISTFIENNIINDKRYSFTELIEDIKKDTIEKRNTLLKIKSGTLKKIIIIVPGDSGFRQVKAIELYLKKTKQDENIKFVYIPLSGIKNIEPTDELLQYFKESINGTHENYFIIYDFLNTGVTIDLIKNILNKLYNNPNIFIQEISNFRLLVDADYRCQPKKYFAPNYYKSVSQKDYIHCTNIIAWLFNTLINSV